jgi:structure-specific recognition protein 1
MAFNDMIIKHAGLGDALGEIIATFSDIPLMVPRGKYSMDMYQNYVRFHGRTHDYKIMYKDIVQLF